MIENRQEGSSHLHNAVGPSLSYPIPCPHIMPIFCQFLYELVLVWCQSDVAEIQGGRFVCVAHHISRTHTTSFQTKRGDEAGGHTRSIIGTYVFGNLIFLRFSSAFSSPIPTWQPSARRVLEGIDTRINNRVRGIKIPLPTCT